MDTPLLIESIEYSGIEFNELEFSILEFSIRIQHEFNVIKHTCDRTISTSQSVVKNELYQLSIFRAQQSS